MNKVRFIFNPGCYNQKITKDGGMKHQNGSVHIIVVSLLSVALIAALGFIFWQNFVSSDEATEKETSSKATTKDAASDDTEEVQPSNYATFTSDDAGTYAKSFQYPSSWRIANSEELCSDYNLCTSPPTLALVDDVAHLKLYAPQSASDASIDEQAASMNTNGGRITTDFTSLDGIEARKIVDPNGDTTVVVPMRGGYAYLSLEQISTEDVDTILSTWQW